MSKHQAWPQDVLAVGASGGEGLAGLRALLTALPPGWPMPVLIELHRPSDRESALAQVLSRATSLPVRCAHGGEFLRPGVCYVGEPAGHLTLGPGGCAQLVDGADHVHRGSTIDMLFSSVAQNAGSRGVGLILPGSLADGARGLAKIAASGGRAYVIGVAGVPPAGMPHKAAELVDTATIVDSEDAFVRELAAALRQP